MKIMTYQCPNCKDKIYSRAQHDLIRCSCKLIGLDGGHRYKSQIVWSPERLIGNVPVDDWKNLKEIVDIDVTEKELYDDWNERNSKYGVIKQ